jgi:hypothetical protein
MEEITEKEAERRATACAQAFISNLNKLNARVAEIEKEEVLDLSGTLPLFTHVFVRVLGNRYIIKPDA